MRMYIYIYDISIEFNLYIFFFSFYTQKSNLIYNLYTTTIS